MENYKIDDALSEIDLELLKGKTLFFDVMGDYFDKYDPDEDKEDRQYVCHEFDRYRTYMYVVGDYIHSVHKKVNALLENLRK